METEAHHFYTDPAFWVAIAFVVFIGVLLKYRIHKMIGNALDARAERIRNEIDEARTLKEEAQSILARYQREHRDAKKTADAMVEQVRTEADMMARDAQEALKATMKRQEKALEDRISQLEANAVKEVRAEAVDVAIKAAEDILGRELKGKNQKQLTENSVASVKKSLH